jgi:F-type H+-transporting ATPase subunit a
MLELLSAHEDLPSINAEELFHIGPFTVANSTVFTVFAITSFIVLAILARKFKLIPTKFQHMLEMMYEYLLDLFTNIVGTKDRAKKVLPYAGSVFLYILFSNLVPMIPGIMSFTYTGEEGVAVPLMRGGTADFNTTFGLALAAVVTVQILAIAERGALGHLGHFIQIKPIITGFKKSIGEGFIGIVHFFVGLIEIVGELAKVISLSLRLFGNMFAHEVLTIIIMGALAVGIPVIWMGMGVLVGAVQAIVFTSLITVYYSLVLNKEGEKH